MEAVLINAKKREARSKSEVRNLRRNDQVPCVLYGLDENIHFSATELDFRGLIYTPGFVKAEIDIDGKKYEAVLKATQFHPVTDKLLHVDFLALHPGEKITTQLPIKLIGAPVGVKEGGRLNLNIRKLKVNGLPKDLVEFIEVDVTDLDIGKSIKVGDLDLGDLEVLTSISSPIAAVEIPRALKSLLGEDEEGVEGEEGEEGAEGAEGAEGETPAEGGESSTEG